MHGCRHAGGGGQARVALPVKALKAGQEAYWLDQIARNREEYFSGRGESPGRFVGTAAAAAGLEGVASAEQIRAMFQGLDPATGQLRCAPAADQVDALQGRLLRRRDLQGARDRLVLAEHALQTTTRQADQTAERLGVLRRAQQRHLGWMEAHDPELRVQERAVAREDAWRRRVDQRALALDLPGWLLAELGPMPSDPQGRAVWRAWPPRRWTATGAPTAWTTLGRPSMLRAG
jgi:hypothetical protein